MERGLEVRRLLRFLGVAAAGVVVTLAGLAWDAALHARDHTMAAREGVLTLSNPSHLMFLAGICLVSMGVSASIGVLISSRSRRGSARRKMRASALMAVVALLGASAGGAAVQAAEDGQGLLPALQSKLPVLGGLTSPGPSQPGSDVILRPDASGDLLSGVKETAASTGALADAVRASQKDPIGELLAPVLGLLNFKLQDVGGYWFDSGIPQQFRITEGSMSGNSRIDRVPQLLSAGCSVWPGVRLGMTV